DPKHNLLFWPVYGVNVLFINTAKAPFNTAVFRKAMDMAINKHMLEERAYFGTGGYDISQTAVIPSQRAQWYDPSLKSQDAALTAYDPAGALKLLESAGYKKTANGLMMPDGSPVPPITLLAVSGDTDYITIAQVMSQELKDNLGLPISVTQETYATYKSQLTDGNYQIAIGHPPVQGPNPYFIYDGMFYSGFSAPIGQNAISDYDRYTNPALDKALEQFGSSSDQAVQQQAMYKIEKIMLDEVPTIVLTERTGFDLYNSTNFVGWPSLQDPYSHAWNGTGLGMELVVLKVHKR
ncbi:MAG TPA: ABC transporter substrate-binding protein, partial [Spirochaetia bacterium]|nr:ABC transporter substrate-binding protein [Spirochaetia bacterium]